MSLKTERKALLIEDQLWHLLLLFHANANLAFGVHAFIGKFFLKKIIPIRGELGPKVHMLRQVLAMKWNYSLLHRPLETSY